MYIYILEFWELTDCQQKLRIQNIVQYVPESINKMIVLTYMWSMQQ